MVSKKATKLINENRIQAQRDLDSARVLLASSDPHLENVAFLLEQSFEKIIKTSYTRYKLEIKSASLNKIYENISDHNIDFILDMLDELYKNCTTTLTHLPKTLLDCDELHNIFSKEMKEILRSPENLAGPMKRIQNLKNEVALAKRNFIKFMSKLDSKSIPNLDVEPSDVPQFFTTVENFTNSAADFVPSRKIFQEHLTFLLHLSIAPYIIPHATHSRYPLIQRHMNNLNAYRDNPKLKGFFNALADHIQKMLDSEAGFTKLLVATHSFNSKISSIEFNDA